MKVFVYGTLRQGGRFNPLLQDSEFLGEATAYGFDLYDLGGDVPGMLPGAELVRGELYEVNNSIMLQLRILERGYIETTIDVSTNTGIEKATAFLWPDRHSAYVGHQEPTLVPGGDWMER